MFTVHLPVIPDYGYAYLCVYVCVHVCVCVFAVGRNCITIRRSVAVVARSDTAPRLVHSLCTCN